MDRFIVNLMASLPRSLRSSSALQRQSSHFGRFLEKLVRLEGERFITARVGETQGREGSDDRPQPNMSLSFRRSGSYVMMSLPIV